MKNKMSLEEATIKNLYDQLQDDEEFDNVEGIVDDVLVITDPEVTDEEYDEIIEKAQELVEDTPEGEIPLDDEFLGEYVLTCPLCGQTFTNDSILEPGATCPLCLEVPEAFVVKGRLESEENVLKDYEEEQSDEANNELPEEETSDEPTEEPEQEELEASEQVKTSDKKLQEGKLEESTQEEEVTFDDIEEKLTDADGYDELLEVISLIKKDNIRKDIEDLINEYKRRGETPDSACSAVITDIIDPISDTKNVVESVKITEDYSNGIVYTIKFNTSSAAFDDYGEGEVDKVLQKLAERIKSGDVEGSVMDSNGNECLTFTSEEEIIEENKEVVTEDSNNVKKVTEEISTNEVVQLHQQIEDAEDMQEIQDIIYSISDGVLENEVQQAFDSCESDGDDLDVAKGFIISTLEDNAEYSDE